MKKSKNNSKRQLLIKGCISLLLLSFTLIGQAQNHPYYEEPTWKPRGILPYEDAINDNFWPKSPEVKLTYNDPTFDKERLSKVPAPGIYPRVLITPTDVEAVRAKLALGDKAPLTFRSLWQRFAASKGAFYALVTKDNTLGKELAKQLVEKIKGLQPKLEEMDKHPDRDNIWAVERSIVASGSPDPPSEMWDILDYDYLHDFMTADEQELTRATIAKICYHRISNFLMVPDHYMINNHEGFGMEYIRLMLLIEGQKGFDQKMFDLACHKANAMLSWYLDKDGMCYESIKGWLNVSAFVSVGLRQRNLLMHDHLQAKMKFFRAAIRWEDGVWHIRDEMRASAFHVIWMMHYYHPKDEAIDFLYQSTFSTHSFLTDASAKWPNPVGICNELLLLFADEGMKDKSGNTIDWTNQTNLDRLHLPTTWQDSARGYVDVRNSWKKEDLHVGFVCKQDFFYGGHEGSENNRLTLWKDGVNWIQDNNMLATKATFLQNMLTVDGKGCHWPPAPGTWLGIKESPDGVVACGDGKNGYSFYKSMQVHPLFFPSAKLPYYAPFAEGNFDLDRNMQIAFHPGTIRFTDGFAHTDYGPWSGETRLVEGYKPWNTMEQAYRTVHVAKGLYPYVLVIDDAKKDNQLHQFDWNISVPVDADLISVNTPEVQFQNTEPSDVRIDDIILGKATTSKDPKTGKYAPKKGDPLCLIRVLWRNTDYGFPIPKFEKFEGYSLVTIPARAVSPEFKVLVYPYRFGDPLPVTTWNKDRTKLNIDFKGQKDGYQFSQTDGGRTVFNWERDGNPTLTSDATPAKPNIIVRGQYFNQNDYRYTRNEKKTPVYLLDDSLEVQFERVQAPAEIHYTLDGSEPTINAPVYDKSIIINKSTTLKGKTFNSFWKAGNQASETITATFVARPAEKGLIDAPVHSKKGLQCKLFELNTKIYNNKGFFEANRIMMPDLSKETPSVVTSTAQFSIPLATPSKPLEQQVKGFYQFNGWFYAKEKGVYTFEVYSNGPVLFDIGKQTVIEATGIFHQQLSHRKGEASLDKGWHNLNCIVCDPMFWNINSLDAMPLEVSYSINGGKFQIATNNELVCNDESSIQSNNPIKNPLKLALSNPPLFEYGLDLKVYDQTGKRLENDFLDIENKKPIHSERTYVLEATSSRNTVRVYNAYFNAPSTGVYTFKLPSKNGEAGPLGGTRSSCQNQVRIDGEVVAQRGVYGRNLTGEINLAAGWHTISLRYGPSDPSCKVIMPDGQTIALNAYNLKRPSLVSILPNELPTSQSVYEIYNSTKFGLVFNSDKNAEIRYTLDGTSPTINSELYTKPFNISKTTTITASVFNKGKAVTVPSVLECNLVQIPEQGSLGKLDFSTWDGKTSEFKTNTNFKIWIAPESFLTDGMHSKKALMFKTEETNGNGLVDVNVSRPKIKAGFKLYDLKLRENALSIALWFKTNEKSGKIFGKEGYTAFGKSYKTLSLTLNNGSLLASPNRMNGGKITQGEWQFVVLAADENHMELFLNGEKVASADGTKEINTDALDFFVGHPAVVDNLQVFDKALNATEVKRLFEFGSK